MTVLVKDRKESKFEVFHNAFNLRRTITNLALEDFGYVSTEKWKERETEKQYKRRMGFYKFFLAESRVYMIGLLRELGKEITFANKIFPTNMVEFEERRLHQSRAVSICHLIIQELQYIIETLPVNINKFMEPTKQINKEIELLKGWRKADGKRFREKVKDIECIKDEEIIADIISKNNLDYTNNASLSVKDL